MAMLMRTDPFRQLEQWSRQLFGQPGMLGTPRADVTVPSRSRVIPRP
jgi:hypothetical protein